MLFNSYFKYFIVLGGAHCGIHKSSYNISNTSYLNLPFSTILLHPSPHSWNSFNRYHFSTYTHVYTVFALYSPSMPFPHPLPPSLDKVLPFFKRKKNDIFVCLR
jgi:hypothetical protein